MRKDNVYDPFINDDCEVDQDEDDGRDLLYPNADDEEYEEELMDQCFKEM